MRAARVTVMILQSLAAKKLSQAQKHFQALLEMEAPEELRGLARDGLRKIAARELKARGPRMDAVFYLLDAMRLFRGKSLQESF